MIARVLALEWRLWKHRRAGGVIAASVPAATILYALLARSLSGTGLPGTALPTDGSGAAGYALAFHTMRAMARLLAIVAVAWGAFAIAPEIESGRHRLALLRVSRGAWFAGKSLFPAAVAAALLGVATVISLAAGAWCYSLGGIRAGGFEIQSGGALFASALAAALLMVVSLATLVAFGAAMSAHARSGEMALFLALAGLAILWGVSLLPGAEHVVFIAKADWPLAVASSRSEGLRTESFSRGLPGFLAVHAAWIVALVWVGLLRIRRRDLP